ncbi:hypothetical protein N2152v2_007603 [Parachlorella kessleri]
MIAFGNYGSQEKKKSNWLLLEKLFQKGEIPVTSKLAQSVLNAEDGAAVKLLGILYKYLEGGTGGNDQAGAAEQAEGSQQADGGSPGQAMPFEPPPLTWDVGGQHQVAVVNGPFEAPKDTAWNASAVDAGTSKTEFALATEEAASPQPSALAVGTEGGYRNPLEGVNAAISQPDAAMPSQAGLLWLEGSTATSAAAPDGVELARSAAGGGGAEAQGMSWDTAPSLITVWAPEQAAAGADSWHLTGDAAPLAAAAAAAQIGMPQPPYGWGPPEISMQQLGWGLTGEPARAPPDGYAAPETMFYQPICQQIEFTQGPPAAPYYNAELQAWEQGSYWAQQGSNILLPQCFDFAQQPMPEAVQQAPGPEKRTQQPGAKVTRKAANGPAQGKQSKQQQPPGAQSPALHSQVELPAIAVAATVPQAASSAVLIAPACSEKEPVAVAPPPDLPRIEYDRRPRPVDFKPYTQKDYELADLDIKKAKGYWELGSLGPDYFEDEEWRQKWEKLERQKEFGKVARAANQQKEKEKPPPGPKVKPVSTRDKALEFAKRVPRPSVALPCDTAGVQVLSSRDVALEYAKRVPRPSVALPSSAASVQVLSSRDVALEYAKRVPRPSVAMPNEATRAPVTEQLSKLQLESLSGREKDGLADLIRAEFGTGVIDDGSAVSR